MKNQIDKLKLDKEEINEFINYSSNQDYDYVVDNIDKINKILDIFDKYNLNQKSSILIEKTYIFYESIDFIENTLKNNVEKIDEINDSIDIIDELFS